MLHQYHKEQLSLELSLELDIKRRFSVMTIDDQTNQNDACCGNVTGMCCDQHIMPQNEILQKTYDAYKFVPSQSNSRSRLLDLLNQSSDVHDASRFQQATSKNEFNEMLYGEKKE